MIHRILLTTLVILAAAAAPGDAAVVRGATVVESMVHDGRLRTWRLHVPWSYDAARPTPLVLALHPAFNSGASMEGISGLSAVAERRGFIVAYPDGIDGHWFGSTPGVLDAAAGEASVRFVSALIDRIGAGCRLDRRRVFATGYSEGGGLSMLLQWRLADRIAAIAPVAAAIPRDFTYRLPDRPVSALWINGTADATVPYEGGPQPGSGIVLTAPWRTVAAWAQHDGAWPVPVVQTLPNWIWWDWCWAERRTWVGGAQGSEMVLYTIHGGGHTWPGSALTPWAGIVLGNTCADFDAGEVIWEFFARHPLPAIAAGG